MTTQTELTPDWHRTFFSGIAMELLHGLMPAEQTQNEVEAIVRWLDLKPGGRILDFPCGDGRHSVPLAERGYHVTGIDLSTEALAYARQSVGERPMRLELRNADMRDALEADAFDGA